MHLYKTVDVDDYVRIEEDSGAAITLYLHDDIATVISIIVPKADRDDGIGCALLSAAEAEACKRGIVKIEADYSTAIDGMTDFFDAMEYEIHENGPICAIDTKMLLNSEPVKKLLRKNLSGVKFLSLEELVMSRMDELLDNLSKLSLRLNAADLGAFSKGLSGVVYGSDGVLQAIVLCSEHGRDVHVDFLVSVQKENRTCVMAALQSMLMEIYSSGGAARYPRITAFFAHDTISGLVGRVFSRKPEEIGKAMYAVKELRKDEASDIEIDDEYDEDIYGEWRREISRVPLQGNIEWKAAWYRDRLREKAKAANKGLEREQKKEQEGLPAKEDEVFERMSESETSAFPYELLDALDIDYGYDKDEDETDGLVNDGIRRITIDNLDEFREILPAEAFQDIPRPWYRGLVSENGADRSYLVYELKDIDAKENGRSEIRWIALGDGAQKLLEEYTNEARHAGVGKSAVETAPSKEIQTALLAAGFRTDEREGDTIIVTVADLVKLPFKLRRTPDYVRALSEISERQFKRGIGNCMLNNRKGLLSDLPFLPMGWFEQDVSSVVITDNRVSGVLLVHQLASRRLSVDLLFSSSGDARLDIQRMIIHSIQAAADKYPKDTPVLIRRHDKKVHALADRLFPHRTGERILYGEREEV